jgi:hypothetical protein
LRHFPSLPDFLGAAFLYSYEGDTSDNIPALSTTTDYTASLYVRTDSTFSSPLSINPFICSFGARQDLGLESIVAGAWQRLVWTFRPLNPCRTLNFRMFNFPQDGTTSLLTVRAECALRVCLLCSRYFASLAAIRL